MKKLITALMLLVCSSSLFAQDVDVYGLPINSLNVQVSDAMVPTALCGVGVGLGLAIGAGFAAVLTGGNATIESPEFKGWTPYMSVGYDYHFADTRWTVGPEVGYWHYGLQSSDSYQHIHFPTLTAAGKFYYKPAGKCKLYGGLNLGVGTVFTTTVNRPAPVTKADDGDAGDTVGATEDSSSSSDDPSIFPVVQLTPIGMRLGSEKVAFTAELGVGYKGFLQLGVNVAL
ncbi:MAG: hypothetical protein IKX71_05940 [Bacteroidales bacterium]|nr:hypothetical protein [Bacteroidales bacterium]